MLDIIHEVGQKLCNNMYTSSINHILYNISVLKSAAHSENCCQEFVHLSWIWQI